MKTKEVTVENAFAWSEKVLLDKLKKDKGDYIVLDADIALTLKDPGTRYYESAVNESLLEYIFQKGRVFDSAFKVVMTVKTKDGVDHPYSITITQIYFRVSDPDAINQELIKPTVRKLVLFASSEIPFSNVKSVTCYVEEVENNEE